MGVKFFPFLIEMVLSNLDTMGIHKGQPALMYSRKSNLFVVFGKCCCGYLWVKLVTDINVMLICQGLSSFTHITQLNICMLCIM